MVNSPPLSLFYSSFLSTHTSFFSSGGESGLSVMYKKLEVVYRDRIFDIVSVWLLLYMGAGNVQGSIPGF